MALSEGWYSSENSNCDFEVTLLWTHGKGFTSSKILLSTEKDEISTTKQLTKYTMLALQYK